MKFKEFTRLIINCDISDSQKIEIMAAALSLPIQKQKEEVAAAAPEEAECDPDPEDIPEDEEPQEKPLEKPHTERKTLSKSEFKKMYAAGYMPRVIGEHFGISTQTVKNLIFHMRDDGEIRPTKLDTKTILTLKKNGMSVKNIALEIGQPYPEIFEFLRAKKDENAAEEELQFP